MSTTKTILIIGAGPAGLAALKAVLETPQFASGLWTPIVFESRSDVGGVWLPGEAPEPNIRPPTPLYDSLTTNLPHPLMSYEDFPFPPSTAVFPKAHVVHAYLAAFALRFKLRKYIVFNTSVIDVSYSQPRPNYPLEKPWTVKTSILSTVQADLIIVCNGHYAIPRLPDLPSLTPGLKVWLEQGRAFHSMWYRHPIPLSSSFSNSILIVGAGPSGQDLCADHLAAGYTVIHSNSQPSSPVGASDRLKRRPRVKEYGSIESGTVIFEDGSIESGIGRCIVATGYEYSYPFFTDDAPSSQVSSPPFKVGFPPPIPPLPSRLFNSTYSVFPLAQHIWPIPPTQESETESSSNFVFPPPTSLAFLGVLSRVSPLPLVQVQARAVLAAFAHPENLNIPQEIKEIKDRYHSLSSIYTVEDVYKNWHKFEPMEQYDYRDRLSLSFPSSLIRHGPNSSSDASPDPATTLQVPKWHREMYMKKDVLRQTWRALEARGEAEEWVRGVGTGEEWQSEWEGLLRRLVEKGEREGIIKIQETPSI